MHRFHLDRCGQLIDSCSECGIEQFDSEIPHVKRVCVAAAFCFVSVMSFAYSDVHVHEFVRRLRCAYMFGLNIMYVVV